jgi:hypothetical protein
MLMRAMAASSLALPLLPQARADAAVASDGNLEFAGTTGLPTFPCPAPAPGQYACVGTFTASTVGTADGVYGDSPWYVAIDATTNGEFSYADSVQPGVPCAEGTARGTASLDTAATGQAFGTYKDGNQARSVRSASITYSFHWDRTGATAVLDVSDVAIVLDVDGIGHVPVLSGGTASAIASFVPNPDSPAPTGCVQDPSTELHGSIAGAVSGVSVQP